MDIENRLVASKAERIGGAMEQEIGVKRYKLKYMEWMDKFLLQSTEIYIQYPNINHNGENIHRLLWQTIGQDSTLSLQGMQVQSLVRRQIPHAGQCSQKQNKTKKRLNKIMCKYIHTYTMYMYTYMCIIETLCCKAEINRTLESSCASLKKYHHWEKKRLVCFIVRKVYIQRKLL